MTTTSMQFGQSAINVVLNEGQMPAKLSTDNSGNTVLVGADENYTVHTAAYDEAVIRLRQSDYGTMVTDLSDATIVANGTPASGSAGLVYTDRAPVKTQCAVRLIGAAATRASVTSQFTAAQATGAAFRGIAFWAKVKGRTAGPMMAQIYIGATSDPYTGKALGGTVAVPADSKWHLLYVPRRYLAEVNAFVMGTDTLVSIGIRDRNDSANLSYPGMLTNAEELQLGPVYINPYSRPKFLIRFDDSLDDCIVPTVSFAADGVTQSWSCKTLMEQYGFGDKGSIFHLTRRLNTSNQYQTFLTTAHLAELAAAGWSHCIQSHQDPADNSNNGLRLMGPTGYTAKAVFSVDTSANTITASAVHNISSGNVYWGYPVLFAGTDLPAPLVIDTVYWARYSSTTAFTLHPTETDAIANTNTIDLTTTGTAANFTFRYGYSANDNTLQQADLENAIAELTALGYGDTATIYAPNQGAIDANIMAAATAAGVEVMLGISSNGTGYAYPQTRQAHMETTGGYANLTVIPTSYTVPSAIQTDGVPVAADIQTYVDAVIAAGGVGQNYHHGLTAGTGANLAAYLAHLRLRVSEGACDVVTAEELRDYLVAAKSLTPGVVY